MQLNGSHPRRQASFFCVADMGVSQYLNATQWVLWFRMNNRKTHGGRAGAIQDANELAGRVEIARNIMDCGGMRSATPLSCGQRPSKTRGLRGRAKAPSPLALCRRSP
jgi:hypothetical protein